MIQLNRAERPRGRPLSIVTDSFATADFDFDIAALSVGLAVEARQSGLDVEMIFVADYDVSGRLARTTELLATLNVPIRIIVARGGRQQKAMALSSELRDLGPRMILSMAPDLTAYAAEAEASANDATVVASILCRPTLYSQRALGIFVDDPLKFAEQALLLRGLRATPLRFAAGGLAEAFCADHDVDAAPLDWISAVAALADAIGAPSESRGTEPEAPGTLAILGNLDTRSGIEAIFEIVAGSGSTPEVALLGQPGRLPTDHAINEIARFVTLYGGLTTLDFRTDVVRSIRNLQAGDLVARWASDGLDCAAVIAVAFGLPIVGRRTERIAAWLGSGADPSLAPNLRLFGRMLREALHGAIPVARPAAAGTAGAWLDGLRPGTGPESRHVRPPAAGGRSSRIGPSPVDMILLADTADDPGIQDSARAIRDALGMAGDTFVLAPAIDGAASDVDVMRYRERDGLGGALLGMLHSRRKGSVLVLRHGQRPAPGVSARIPAPRSGTSCLIFPLLDRDGQLHAPALTVPQLLRATSDSVFPLLIECAVLHRAGIAALDSRTVPGAMRELTLRMLMAAGELQDLPSPVFQGSLALTAVNAAYRLQLADDARLLAAVAAEWVPEALRDALRLFQEPGLRELYPQPRFPITRTDAWPRPDLFRYCHGLGRGEAIIDGIAPSATGPRAIEPDPDPESRLNQA